ncbi:MAG: TlpA family protein disulfide reductase, partial [Porphyromonas sp.]
IYSDPRSPAAYFALFQSYKGGTYFSVDSPGDDRAFAAVGTAYEAFYPNAPYTPLLKQAALRSVALARARRQASQPDSLATRQVEAVAFPEIQLKDQQGQLRSLRAEVAKGRPVLVSFTSYAAAWSPALVAELRRLQSSHPDLLIFEVSLDQDAYLWKNASRSLPWISTQDLSREAAVDYNVQSLPSFFSIRGTELRRLDEPADILR